MKGGVKYITSVEGKWSVGRKEGLKIQERNYLLLSAYMGDLYISPTYTVGLRLNILHILFNFQQSIMK